MTQIDRKDNQQGKRYGEKSKRDERKRVFWVAEKFEDRLEYELNAYSIKLEKSQINQFYHYFRLLVEKNKMMNLTAITEQNEVITKHFVDSLSLIKIIEDMADRDYDIIDVGTGAGFPGIPLKIAFPMLNMTLLDSINKKVDFLNEVIKKLELQKIKVIHGRAEEVGRDQEHRECYDISVSRAVANLSTLVEYCIPFVRPGGFFVAYKSGKIKDELLAAKNACFLLGGKVCGADKFILDGRDTERTLIKIEKVRSTPKKYPRKAGLPAKIPLKCFT